MAALVWNAVDELRWRTSVPLCGVEISRNPTPVWEAQGVRARRDGGPGYPVHSGPDVPIFPRFLQ